jgi:hypothetical protein
VVRAGGRRGHGDRFALLIDQLLSDRHANGAQQRSPLDHEDWDPACPPSARGQ